ncbi:MAG TPA: gluconate 2-dehydrogenase subunit 3 family protein [Bryobacteraceae bacterium]|nr:gluconate 2-dehydrogenase subunit 3 family protein [Bryobacteraceae bacterium]
MRSKNSPGVSRRAILQTIAAAPVAATAAPAQTPAKAPYQRKVFNAHQWQTVEVLCDLIIPADERSVSASKAGVPEFMDDWLDFRAREEGTDLLTAEILGGLTWLDQESVRLFGKDFAGAAAAQQKQLLDRIAWPAKAAPEDRRWASFFNRFRDLTVSGFFSSQAGVADLPYLGNKAVSEWKGCDPKVWAILEKRLSEQG